MKLSTFIQAHLEEILSEWDSLARTFFPVSAGMSTLALRDHAKQILQEFALDIETDQTSEQQSEKSKGLALREPGTDSAASTHGTQRQYSGFTLVQVTAEFRALRATVLRLWLREIAQVTEEISDDMVRFNEAIDQALAESVVTYYEQAARTRDIFLAILGHDLRSPLAVMAMAGTYLTSTKVATSGTHIFTDFLEVNLRQVNPLIRGLLKVLLNLRTAEVVNAMVARVAKRSPVAEWGIAEGMHVTGTSSPYEFLLKAAQFHTTDVSGLVKQDVLLLAGREDQYVPVRQFHQQIRMLTNARSVTARLFTGSESAGNHCQVGNYGLALRTIVNWLDGMSKQCA